MDDEYHITQRLARAFSNRLKIELGTFTFGEMVARHRAKSIKVDYCVSHDYCDANMAMLEACHELNVNTANLGIINAAWSIAQRRSFYWVDPRPLWDVTMTRLVQERYSVTVAALDEAEALTMAMGLASDPDMNAEWEIASKGAISLQKLEKVGTE